MIVITGNDIIQHMTQKIVAYLDASPEQRREAKQKKQENKPVIQYNRWFGVLPFAFKTWRKKVN